MIEWGRPEGLALSLETASTEEIERCLRRPCTKKMQPGEPNGSTDRRGSPCTNRRTHWGAGSMSYGPLAS